MKTSGLAVACVPLGATRHTLRKSSYCFTGWKPNSLFTIHVVLSFFQIPSLDALTNNNNNSNSNNNNDNKGPQSSKGTPKLHGYLYTPKFRIKHCSLCFYITDVLQCSAGQLSDYGKCQQSGTIQAVGGLFWSYFWTNPSGRLATSQSTLVVFT